MVTTNKFQNKKHKFEALAGPDLDKKCLAFGTTNGVQTNTGHDNTEHTLTTN